MVELKGDERAAWDKYADGVLRSLVAARPIGADDAAKIAAGFADQLILERRKRAPDPEMPGGLAQA